MKPYRTSRVQGAKKEPSSLQSFQQVVKANRRMEVEEAIAYFT